MPQLVGHVADDLGMIALGHRAVELDIGDVGQFGMPEAVRTALELAQAQVQRAQRAGKGDLLVFIQRLPAEHQHRVAVHRLLDLLHLGVVQRLAQVDAAGFGREGLQGLQLQGHGGLTPGG